MRCGIELRTARYRSLTRIAPTNCICAGVSRFGFAWHGLAFHCSLESCNSCWLGLTLFVLVLLGSVCFWLGEFGLASAASALTSFDFGWACSQTCIEFNSNDVHAFS